MTDKFPNPEWLRKMADAEDQCVSVGVGAMTDYTENELKLMQICDERLLQIQSLTQQLSAAMQQLGERAARIGELEDTVERLRSAVRLDKSVPYRRSSWWGS